MFTKLAITQWCDGGSKFRYFCEWSPDKPAGSSVKRFTQGLFTIQNSATAKHVQNCDVFFGMLVNIKLIYVIIIVRHLLT